MPELFQFPSELIVLNGKTGSSKSAVIEFLSSLQYPVIRLERIARHRGSVFGSTGIDEQQPSQHFFEKQLKQICEVCRSRPFIFTEQKPSSIGKRKIPEWLYARMQAGLIVELHVSKNIRVQHIIKEYFDTKEKRQYIFSAVSKLSGRFSREKIVMLQELILQKNCVAFVNELLDYYDQAAKYKTGGTKPFIEIFAGEEYNTEDVAKQILKSLNHKGIILF